MPNAIHLTGFIMDLIDQMLHLVNQSLMKGFTFLAYVNFKFQYT